MSHPLTLAGVQDEPLRKKPTSSVCKPLDDDIDLQFLNPTKAVSRKLNRRVKAEEVHTNALIGIAHGGMQVCICFYRHCNCMANLIRLCINGRPLIQRPHPWLALYPDSGFHGYSFYMLDLCPLCRLQKLTMKRMVDCKITPACFIFRI